MRIRSFIPATFALLLLCTAPAVHADAGGMGMMGTPGGMNDFAKETYHLNSFQTDIVNNDPSQIEAYLDSHPQADLDQAAYAALIRYSLYAAGMDGSGTAQPFPGMEKYAENAKAVTELIARRGGDFTKAWAQIRGVAKSWEVSVPENSQYGIVMDNYNYNMSMYANSLSELKIPPAPSAPVKASAQNASALPCDASYFDSEIQLNSLWNQIKSGYSSAGDYKSMNLDNTRSDCGLELELQIQKSAGSPARVTGAAAYINGNYSKTASDHVVQVLDKATGASGSALSR